MKDVTLEPGEKFVLPLAEWLAMFTVETAAKKLKVNRARVYQLIESDGLEGVRLLDGEGDLIKVLVTQRSVDAYRTYRDARQGAQRPSFA